MADIRVRHLSTSIPEAIAQEAMKAKVAKLEANMDYLAMMSDVELPSDEDLTTVEGENNG